MSFSSYNRFYSIPSTFNIVHIGSEVLIVYNNLICIFFKSVDSISVIFILPMKSLFCLWIFCIYETFSNFFLAVIDFWMPGVIQGLDLNFNLYLSILFNSACSSNIELILSKNNSIDTFKSFGLIGEHQTNLYQNSQVESLFE